MLRRAFQVSTECPCCHIDEETTLHVFFECNFARGVWFGCPLRAKLTSLHGRSGLQILEWLLEEDACTNSNTIGQLAWHNDYCDFYFIFWLIPSPSLKNKMIIISLVLHTSPQYINIRNLELSNPIASYFKSLHPQATTLLKLSHTDKIQVALKKSEHYFNNSSQVNWNWHFDVWFLFLLTLQDSQ